MARIYIYNCTCGQVTLTKEEFVKPTSYSSLGAGRYKVDLTSTLDSNDGYPSKEATCTSCGQTITSEIYEVNKVPPVYYNYMGDD